MSTKYCLCCSYIGDRFSTFEELGVSKQLAETCRELGWTKPTDIQEESIPWALQGRDLIALAKTGTNSALL